MADLVSITAQIEKLQKQADEIKSKEFSKTLADIIDKMKAFGITIKDIQAAMQTKKEPKQGKKQPVLKKGKKAGKTVAVKYRNESGQSWSGRGLTPKWMAEAIALGKSRDDFLIEKHAHGEPTPQ